MLKYQDIGTGAICDVCSSKAELREERQKLNKQKKYRRCWTDGQRIYLAKQPNTRETRRLITDQFIKDLATTPTEELLEMLGHNKQIQATIDEMVGVFNYHIKIQRRRR